MDRLPPPPSPNPGTGSIRSQLSPLGLIAAIFLLNMLARIGLGPILPTMEHDLAIGHTEAGLFFLALALGYTLILILAGFISDRLTHRGVIIISAAAVGLCLIGISLSKGVWTIRAAMFFLGVTTGLYLPSGVATLTSLVKPKDWGKVLSLHQLSPNLAYVIAPLLVEVFLVRLSWRHLLAGYGVCSLIMGLLFWVLGRGGDFKSQPPTFSLFRELFSNPRIWILIILFSMAIGTNQGLFGMMTLYLINGRGLDPTLTNHLIAASRVAAFAMPLFSGWLADRIGLGPVMKTVLLLTGTVTLGLSLVPGSWLPLAVVLQAMAGVCFFPLGFAALSGMTTPSTRSLAVSATIPLAYLIGTGLIPTGVGYLGELGRFDLAIGILGGLNLLGFSLLFIRTGPAARPEG